MRQKSFIVSAQIKVDAGDVRPASEPPFEVGGKREVGGECEDRAAPPSHGWMPPEALQGGLPQTETSWMRAWVRL